MLLQIIFMVTMYPILFLVYFFLRNAGGVDKAYIYGATLKKEYRTEAEIVKITEEYKSSLKRTGIILGIIPLITFFIPWISISFTVWMVWSLVVCFYPMFYAARANIQVQELKRKKGWYEEYNTSYVDLKIAAVPRKVTLETFLAPILCSIVPILIALFLFQGRGYAVYIGIVAIFGLCTLLFYAAAVWTDKQKIMVISSDSDINMNYARAKKVAWKNYWVYNSWVNTAFTWLVLILVWFRHMLVRGILVGSVIYAAVVILFTWKMIQTLDAIEQRYEAKKDIKDAADDDRNWIFGMFYYNKNDKHYMTQNRFGTGTTVNLGTTAGMLTEIVGILALAIVPLCCVWMIMMEFTPINLKIEQDTIICEQLSVEYEIPLAQIEEYQAVTELPELIKVNGTGMDNLLSGTFEAYRQGMFELFLNPQNDLFIHIVTDEETYYISGTDDKMTQEILEQMEAYSLTR
uniref:PH domain-containing protein n=1 Tax=Agathobacter sp. TaxID=2021311 RepID=UPI004056FAEE